MDENSEVTLELDPGTFTKGKLDKFKELGRVNRVSMGVQTFLEKEFNQLGRGH